ncbi:MAG: M28 family peptidase, partial [Bacteroidales bacterium]|nr:M28 family peptidase [Bacteroidales bacterium]
DRHDENKYHKSVFMICDGKNSSFYKRLVRQLNVPNKNLFIKKYPLPFSNFALKSFSDHFIFSKKGIPFVHFQTGMHLDNHTVNDTPEKINYEKLMEICKLVYNFIWQVANTDKDLEVNISVSPTLLMQKVKTK